MPCFQPVFQIMPNEFMNRMLLSTIFGVCKLILCLPRSPISTVKFCFRPITLVVAKCWDPNPKGYFTVPRQEPVRPMDPSTWVTSQTDAMRGMWGRGGAPSVSTMTSASSSIVSSVPPHECRWTYDYVAIEGALSVTHN